VEITNDRERIPKESLQPVIDPFYTVGTGGQQGGDIHVLGDVFALLPRLRDL
jgi:hypothetical protein